MVSHSHQPKLGSFSPSQATTKIENDLANKSKHFVELHMFSLYCTKYLDDNYMTNVQQD